MLKTANKLITVLILYRNTGSRSGKTEVLAVVVSQWRKMNALQLSAVMKMKTIPQVTSDMSSFHYPKRSLKFVKT